MSRDTNVRDVSTLTFKEALTAGRKAYEGAEYLRQRFTTLRQQWDSAVAIGDHERDDALFDECVAVGEDLLRHQRIVDECVDRLAALKDTADAMRTRDTTSRSTTVEKFESGDDRGTNYATVAAPRTQSGIATVERDQSFGQHHLVRSALEAERNKFGELHFGRYIRGLATGEWHGAESEQRAMSEGVLAAGGYTVPIELSSQIIDRARNLAAVMRAGAQTVPMATLTLNIARLTGDPTAAFRLENASITPSDAVFDQVQLKAKSLAALTVCSRELLEDSINVDDALRDAFAAQAALTLDASALRGSGTDPSPRGVRNTSGVAIESMGTNGLALANYDRIVDTIFGPYDNNETPTGAIYNARTARTLAKFKNTTNQPLVAPSTFTDLPRFVSNQIPNNITHGTAVNASELYVGNWAQLLIGLRTRFTVQVLTERYAELGQVAFLSWWRGDVAVARSSAFAVLTGIIP